MLNSLLIPICFSIKSGVIWFPDSRFSNNLSISLVILVRSIPKC